MPRHFTQADYNAGSPSPPGGQAVSYDFSTMSFDPNEVTGSHSPCINQLKMSQPSPRNAVADDRSRVSSLNNKPIAKPSSLSRQSKVASPSLSRQSKAASPGLGQQSKIASSGQRSRIITPDQNSKSTAYRASVQSVHSQQSQDNSIHESQYHINMTRYEELFPDFTQGNIHDYSIQNPAPALPNAKELMSGVFEDGTPVFSPVTKKPRGSRFVSGSQSRDSSGKVEVAPIVEDNTLQFDVKKPRGSRFASGTHSRDISLKVDISKVVEEAQEVAPPFDEKKVLASLDFLEKKVAALEKNRTQDEITIQQLRMETRNARVENKDRTKWRRSDSALGSTDGGSERGEEITSSQRKLMVEKSRLEATIKTLQSQVNELNQAVSESDININKLIRDRDSAVSQLGVAYFTVEQLKAEVQRLRDESVDVEELQAENQSLRDYSVGVQQLQAENQTLRDRSTAIEQLQAENQTLREDKAMLKHSVEQLIANQEDSTMDMTTREENLDREYERKARLDARQKELDKMTKNNNYMRHQQSAFDDELSQRKDETRVSQSQNETRVSQRKDEARVLQKKEEAIALKRKDETRVSLSSSRSSNDGDDDSAHDITYLSIPDPGKMGKLRKTLENERIARKKAASRRQARKTDVADTQFEKTPAEDDSQQLTAPQTFPFGLHDTIPQRSPEDPPPMEAKWDREYIAEKYGVDFNVPLPPMTEQNNLSQDKSQSSPLGNFLINLIAPVPEESSTDAATEKKNHSRDNSQQFGAEKKSLIDFDVPLPAQASKGASVIEQKIPEGTQQLTTSRKPHGRVDTPAVRTESRFSNTKPEDMTSEWIVNDITLDFSGYEGRAPPTPSQEARIPYHEHLPPAFPMPAGPERKNRRKENKTASKSIAVSKQVSEPTPLEEESILERPPYEEEPTARPSQPPATALKSVMTALEDELSQSKRQLAQFQELYNHQNPALGKRARKSLKEKMEVLLRAIDGKADHIYSLYDVLEGQKQQGSDLTSQQVQATLRSVGVEVPWEGIITESDTQRSNSTSRSRRIEA